MKKIIHVNQLALRTNKKSAVKLPPISIKTYKSNERTNEVFINGKCKLIYSPDKPLKCGATVWIECESDCEVFYDKI